MPKLTLVERIKAAVERSRSAIRGEVADGSNISDTLADLFFWQEVKKYAETEQKKAWAAAQSEDGPIDTDADLRKLGTGDFINAECERISLIATVGDPRNNFDRETFIIGLVKKYKLKRDDLEALAAKSTKPTAAVLTKRLVEA